MHFRSLFFLIVLLVFARSARPSDLTEDLRQGGLESPVGFGSVVGEDGGKSSYALLIDGHHHFTQEKTIWDIRQYGFSESRLELGNHAGASLDALSGITVVGLQAGRRIAPQLGIEPFSGRITLSSLSTHLNYYEWNPMASAGVQAAVGPCKLLVVARGGAGLGNLAQGHLGPALDPALGSAGMLNCRAADFAVSSTEILRGNGNVTLTTADLLIRMHHGRSEIGLRSELATIGNAGSSPPWFSFDPAASSEKRVLLLFRGDLFGTD